MNSGVLFNQWKYQIGSCEGLEMGDQLWMSRFILYRVAESLKVNIELHPKPLKDGNGSGAYVNFSTADMRLEARKAAA